MRKVMGTLYLLVWVCATQARAQTPSCDALEGDQATLAAELLASQHPYDCCDDTLANCLKEKPVCALAYRLAENICKRVAAKQDKEKITRGLSRRARFALSEGNKAEIDLAGAPMVGDSDAPVALVEYACARCPFCSKITPRLHKAIADGALKGKVKLYFKTFPIRSHEHSKEAGLAFMAAAEMGRFWEFALYSYERFDKFCVKKQPDWAKAAGLDQEAFVQLMADPGIRAKLVASKKEGILNKVDATPTFFLNGRKYTGDLTAEEVIDVVEETLDRIQGIEYRK
jgi:protein-disulfide isomerase